ncbi:Gp49 family protein [Serratia bockelmannii]|uniref:Gp49 family protein n=1 Tax=Serratia bockelmannii TaxID=2703793 RepID=UPI00313D6B02
MSDKEIEQEIQAKGKTAPRVTPDHIESIIDFEAYFTAQDGLMTANPDAAQYSPKSLDLLTFCVLVLKNGFTVTGESACASPENFDAEIGRKIARENAVQKIWMLEGYLLKQRMHDDAHLRELLRQKE